MFQHVEKEYCPLSTLTAPHENDDPLYADGQYARFPAVKIFLLLSVLAAAPLLVDAGLDEAQVKRLILDKHAIFLSPFHHYTY
jgi:hypothetical protein